MNSLVANLRNSIAGQCRTCGSCVSETLGSKGREPQHFEHDGVEVDHAAK